MNILVTGAAGFIGLNLVHTLRAIRPDATIHAFDRDSDPADLDRYAQACDFAFHLAGVNRPQDPADFMAGNRDLTRALVDALERHRNPSPLVLSSSIQAALDNPYGLSKRAAEELVFEHARRTGAPAFVYRLPNAFGKGSRPDYNSVIATFCHRAAHGLPLDVREPNRLMTLAYIDDILDEFVRALDGHPTRDGDFCRVPLTHQAPLGDIARRVEQLARTRRALLAPDLSDPLTRKLYATFLSHLPPDDWRTPLEMKTDERGSFTEFLRLGGQGQVSVNVARPGVTKGRHWHHTKSEKFLVVSGQGLIRLRRLDSSEIISFEVSGDRLTVIDIPVGHAHEITNVGQDDLVTLMWASEPFDPTRPDTFFEPVGES
ncbi:MAG: NAD-dependent epimerase/dehydratase family protein [Myxococcaceae bacterium]|nr:NAD-dependent epimerase/dehydratase family protein [Myxococcaceae bacterium]MBR2979050.1 NAD-dependent epimerase/dehydratase family protein [Myxococcaceae bacterium]